MSDLVGTTLGRYDIVARLGRGGMAEVYKAYQPSLSRHVAVKVLHGHLAEDEGFVGRFEREAATVARLRHPNIVQVFDFDVEGDRYYMVMEFIEGPTLKVELDERHAQGQLLPLEETVRILSALASAIDYAHARGMVHRDLKPANVMFTAEGQVVLTDFGIARITGAASYTETGATTGTPAYMSPEQGRGERGDERSDVYSLGVIVYEMVTGRVPFDADTPIGIILKHIGEPVPPPTTLNPDLPEAMEDVILKAMNKAPADRYQAAGELAHALRHAAGMTTEQVLAVVPGAAVVQPPREEEAVPLLLEPIPLPPCPYRGLFAFQEEDAPFFFGRETFTDRLVDALEKQEQPLVAVVGPSGSGKSSVVYAGLLPHLRQGIGLRQAQGRAWCIVDLRPGGNPFHALAAALIPLLETGLSETACLVETRKLADALSQGDVPLTDVGDRILAKSPETGRLLLVVDQFEELYTLCPAPQIRRTFLDILFQVLSPTPPHSHTSASLHLVLTLRADFLGAALAHRPFADALQDADLILGPMTREELRQAIEGPAAKQGATFEAGLVDRVLDDVGSEPGNLPLLEFALTQLWEQQAQGQLTHAAYEAIGRVEGALARYADQVYGELVADEQEQARRVFVQMVRPGEGTEDTRRLAARVELGEANWALVRRLADARLVVTGRDASSGQETVEVVHEALIRGWGRLRGWMDEDRAFRVWQERLRAALRGWEASGRDAGALLRGVPLAEAEQWLAERADDLNPDERACIQESAALYERERAARERLRRRIVLGLAAGLLIALVLAMAAGWGWRSSVTAERALETQVAVRETAQANAEGEAAARATEVALRATAQAEAEDAEAIALSRQLAAQSANQLNEDNWDVGLLLAIEAGRTVDTAEAYAALRRVFAHPGRTRVILSGHKGEVVQAVWNADESRILSAGFDNTARVWDAETGTELFTLSGHTGWVVQAVWNSDESRILTASDDGTARVWDAETGVELVTLSGHESAVFQAVWNSDESRILTASSDGTARVWDAETGGELVTLSGHESAVLQAVWNGDESRILTGSFDGSVRVWDAETGVELLVLSGHTSSINQLAWNSDESRILTANADNTARVWDAETGAALVTLSHGGPVNRAVWNSDGSRILTASWDETARVWDAETGAALVTLPGHTRDVFQAVWNVDESRILTASEDGTARVWDAETGAALVTLSGHTDDVSQAVWNADESRILTRSADGTARVWDAETGAALVTLSGHTGDVLQAVWNADESRILTASRDGTARVWDVEEMGTELPTLSQQPSIVLQAVWNADESRVLIAGDDGAARVWDAETGAKLVALSGHTRAINQAVWNADESRILTASEDGTVRVWEAETGAEQVTLSGHRGNVLQGAWNADESRILTRGVDGTVRVWDVSTALNTGAETGAELVILSGHTGRVLQAVWSSDEGRILTASTDGTARVWDAEAGTELFTLSGHTDDVNQATWNAGESRILTRSADRTVRVWDAETGAELIVISGHARDVNQAAWNSDESRILTASADGTARVWDAETGAELVTLSGHAGAVVQAAWNAGGSRILTASDDGTARVWDAETGAAQIILSGHTGAVNQAVWSGDESLILTASDDGTARVWDAQMGTELFALSGHTDKVWQAVWSKDESRILTASDDGTVRQWYTRMEDLLEAACQRAPRDMTEQEWRRFIGDAAYRATCPGVSVPGD